MSNYNKKSIAVIGLGYVGLTLATVLAENGFRVFGIEKRKEVVDLVNKGKSHFSEVGLDEALSKVVNDGLLVASEVLNKSTKCSIYIITVGTPLDKDGFSRLDMVENATRQVAEHMQDDSFVILRSTLKLGTSRNVVMPILDETNKTYQLAMCPERTLEGNALRELRDLPQIVGAESDEAISKAQKLFGTLTSSVVTVSSLEAAELIKLVDNTYRDVQFGFANEVAKICDAYQINAMEVISSGKLGYKRTNVPIPGLVGGPCLEKDPHILYESGVEKGVEMRITKSARLVNEDQPVETVNFISQLFKFRSFRKNSKIAILGLAFKGIPETDDLRGAMSIKVIRSIEKELSSKIQIELYDPVISPKEIKKEFPNCGVSSSLDEAIEDASVVIVCNNHPSFADMNIQLIKSKIAPNGFIYDYWNHWKKDKTNENFYFAVGNIGKITL